MSPPENQLYELHEQPAVESPVLVIALEGWVDAGLGAATAAATLLAEGPSTTVATFDGNRFIDQRARRPVVRIVDGVTTDLVWPKTELRHGTDRHGADVLYLVGPEPDFHWDEFTGAVVDLSRRLKVRMAVGLGAFPAPAPHTRPVKLAATAPASSSEMIALIGLVQGELEVPAGVVAALELAFAEHGIDVLTLWARVPHYVSAMPFPEASAALVDGLVKVSGLAFDSVALYSAADSARRQVDELIAGSAEHRAMVRKLEESVDASEGNPFGREGMPSGDEIAAELERFLRGDDQS